MIVVHFISGIQSGGVEQMLVNYTVKLNAEYGFKNYEKHFCLDIERMRWISSWMIKLS